MIDFKELAKEYGTPLYVYDFDYMAKQYEALKEAFRGRKSIIAYAVKANSNLSVIKHFAKLGSGADCVSIGEVRRAFLAGIPSYKIIFSGVGKSDAEIREAIERDILYINVESEAELGRVELIAKSLMLRHALVSESTQTLTQKHILTSQRVCMTINLVLISMLQKECTLKQTTPKILILSVFIFISVLS